MTDAAESAAASAAVPPLLAAVPKQPRPRRRWVWGLCLGLALVAGFWVLHRYPPAGNPFYPKCGFHLLTGWHCPGCGSMRAAHHLTHGRVGAALRSNALFTGGLLAAPLVWVLIRLRARFPQALPSAVWAKLTSAWGFAALGALVLAYSILRNLPWPPFNLLAP